MSSTTWSDMCADLTRYVDLPLLLYAFFLLSSLLIVAIYFLPPLRFRFLLYGARSSTADPNIHTTKQHTAIDIILDTIAAIRVPHSWFTHFYLLSTALSAIWLGQIFSPHDARLRIPIIARITSSHGEPSMTLPQAYLVSILIAVQSLRRLAECISFQSSSKSTMWIGHYGLGLLFYVAINMSIWVETQPVFNLQSTSRTIHQIPAHGAFNPTSVPTSTSLYSALKMSTSIAIFLLASITQHLVHAHLASLPKSPNYTLPSDPLFRYLIAPHYLSEVLIYLSLAILASPEGPPEASSKFWWCRFPLNPLLSSALVFVTVNLGVSSEITRRWMAERFGKQGGGWVRERWRMIPLIF